MAALKEVATHAVNSCGGELFGLSKEIWRNPELGLREVKAHELLTDFLEKKGFAVERSYTGIKTAFRATFGSGRPNVCVICEYDALPEIGHACGHNLIAEAGVAAGLGLKAALESKGAPQARVTVLGTPAEETTGGKVDLIRNQALEDVDFCMMVHPSSRSIVMPDFLALKQLEVTFTGRAAHAGASPWEGVNALDAVVVAYNGISVLRQQMKPSWRAQGIVVSGGSDTAVIPNCTTLHYNARAPTRKELVYLTAKVVACFEAAAMATGCSVNIRERGNAYDDLYSNETLSRMYANNLDKLGIDYELRGEFTISTDMGNVSYAVPSIHPMYCVGTGEHIHTGQFQKVAGTVEAHSATLGVAKALVFTGIDVLTTEGMLTEIGEEFKRHTRNN